VLASYEEARIPRALSLMAPEKLAVGGGMACRGEPGLWLNKAVGMGMGVAVSKEDIASVVRFFEEKRIKPRVETCPLAHEMLTRGLAGAGFVVRRWAHVLARSTAGLPAVGSAAGSGVASGPGSSRGGGGGGGVAGLWVRVVEPGDGLVPSG